MSFSSLLKKLSIGILICLGLAIPALAQTPIKSGPTTATSPAATRKELVQQKTEVRKDFLEAKRTAVANLKEKMATREAALKTKLKAFRDQKKATVAERVNTNLNGINAKRTDQMSGALTRMTNILTKLEERVNGATSDIKDPTTAKAAITDAKAAIATAQDAVVAQSEKDYTLTVTSEAKVKQDTQAVREQLHSDLKSTRNLVIKAKQSVANAIRIAKGGTSGQ